MLVVISIINTQQRKLWVVCASGSVCFLPLMVFVVPGIVCIVAVATLVVVVLLLLPLVLETACVSTMIQGPRQHAVKRSVRTQHCNSITIACWWRRTSHTVCVWGNSKLDFQKKQQESLYRGGWLSFQRCSLRLDRTVCRCVTIQMCQLTVHTFSTAS